MTTTNILIVGVGGQGVILASDVLARTAHAAGHDVKKSDVHGMAQRGGSVVSHVRFGERVHSPLVPEGRSDFIAASEQLEALRWLPGLAPGGRIAVSTQKVPPPVAARGEAPYPTDALDRLRARDPHILVMDCIELARQAGNVKTATVVLLGGFSRFFDFSQELWKQQLLASVPPPHRDVNLAAFQLGREAS